MTPDSILAQLTTIFRELFDDNSIVLTRETTAEDIPDWDSFNHINIIVGVEAHFGVKFQTAETEELKNVGHLVDLVERKLQAKKK
jgi:acyl carrier protein